MEELLASQVQKLKVLHRGQEIEGTVLAITGKEITLDLDSKSEGVIASRDIPDSVKLNLKIGDKLKAYVYMPENENGQVVLSSSPQSKIATSSFRGHGINWSKFIQAQNQKSKLQGKVTEINKGGLIVEVTGVRGFLPNSQVGFELLSKSGAGPLRRSDSEASMDNLIGQDLTVTVIEVNQDNNKLIFSQRGQVSEEALKKLRNFSLKQKVKGKIVAVLPFGLVVDVSGVEGLVFISDVSWEKVDDLTKQFSAGQELEILVLGLDEELGRLNLSIKHLTEDPFAKLAEDYPTDEIVKGEVTAVSEAGVTVKLDNIEGFLPVSKMEADNKYEVGASMNFLVDSVDIGRRRINLAPFVTSTAGLIYK
ncbi:MAG: S1 RNA-binding domain-containing protein [Candidatus Daviesbacteria bacterium]|nr:S1 RNA-binding domain-containing protein [Candidatus Daviesbacteria bacterium]